MELSDYVRILRKRWHLIAAVALVGLIAAGGFVLTATKKYTASAQLFISTTNTADASLTAAVQGSDFSEARVTSYAQLVNTPPVMQGVITALGLKLTPQALAGHITASAPLNTVLLNITAKDVSPTQAALLANTTATSFVTVVTALERPADGSPSPVRIAVVKQAFTPPSPTSPKKTLDLALGLLVGLALGVGGAVLRDTLDTSVKDPEEMAKITGQPTLAIVGFDPEIATSPLVIDGSPHAPRAEALRQLRTNLQFVDVDNPPKSVLITSSVPKEGKSSTTANLALTLARGGKKVILVEGDLRRPRIARYLGLPEDLPGVTDVLVGKYTLDEALISFRDEGVMVLSSGHAPPNPSELLGSDAMRELIAQLEARADIVLIDAPPLLPVTDGAVLASICDGAIFVIRAGRTRRDQVSRAVENLTSVDARLLGCVLNMASAKGPDAYAYGYGYDYSDSSTTSSFGSRFRRKTPAPVTTKPTAKVMAPVSTQMSPSLEASVESALVGAAAPSSASASTAGNSTAERGAVAPLQRAAATPVPTRAGTGSALARLRMERRPTK